MTVKKNVAANYAGVIVVIAAPILALPWYLNILGPQQFGLIGFIIMLQAMFGLIDAGMSQALVREVSVRLGLENIGHRKTAELLFGFERIYWLFAIFSALCMALLSGLISRYWLNLGSMPVSLGEQAVVGAAVLFAVQFPGSIYRSLMVGAQVQVPLNVIMAATAILRHVGAVFILMQWPFLFAYLIWHCVIGLIETLLRGHYAWGILNVRRSEVIWSSDALKATWVMVVGMSTATWLGALTVQMDKIILSRMAPIEQFGYYVIAASIAGGVLQMVYPLVQAVLPRAIQLRMEPDRLYALSVRLFKSIAVVVAIVGFIFIMYGQWLLNLWIGNADVVAVVFPILAALLVGSVLNAFYNVGYVNWIAHEKVGRVLQVNAASLVLSVFAIPLLVTWQGVIGAAFGWIVINLFGFLLSLEWLRCFSRKK